MIKAPIIKLLVDASYLTQDKDLTFHEAYLMAIDCRADDIIRFTVFLETGAVWSGLPIEALWCNKFNNRGDLICGEEVKETKELQPYTCLSTNASIIEYALLKNALLNTKLGSANYLFTINYQDSGLAEDPEQYKTHNIVALQSGQLAAIPNNYFTVVNEWFKSKDKTTKDYKRNNKYYFAGG